MGFFLVYQRKLHMILLFAVLGLYAVLYLTTYMFYNEFRFGMYSLYWYPLLALMFLVFMLLRGLGVASRMAPWLSNITLVLELLVQIYTFLFELWVLYADTDLTFNQKGDKPMYDVICYGYTLIAIAVYFLLVQQCALFIRTEN